MKKTEGGKLFNKIFPVPRSSRYSWEIEGVSGKHIIVLEMAASQRWPERLYLNGRLIKTFNKGSFSLIPHIEYSFSCSGETVTLITHGGVADLVHRGKMVSAGIEYNDSQEALPLGVRIFLSLATLSSLVFFFLIGFDRQSPMIGFETIMSVLFAISTSILSWSFATNPFFSKRKKMVWSAAMIVFSWVMIYAISKIGLIFLLE